MPALRTGSLHRPPLLHHLSRFFCGGVGADRARLLPGTVALSTRTRELVVKGDLRGVVYQVARDVATCSGTSQPAKTVCVFRDGHTEPMGRTQTSSGQKDVFAVPA